MATRACLQCGRPTGVGGPGLCLMCRSAFPRTCLRCGTHMPQRAFDSLCELCGELEGPKHMAIAAERKRKAQALRKCDDCNRWSYAEDGPICEFCAYAHERGWEIPGSIWYKHEAGEAPLE